MYFDEFGNEYETREEARKAFEEIFDEKMADIKEFCKELFNFTELTEVLECLCDRDESIRDVLKKQYAKEIEDAKKEYVEKQMYFFERGGC